MDILKKIANAGATVIVTIHQPPPPVVRKIDNLLLLLGGNIMYDGHMGSPVERRFNELGHPKPDDYNIADWILVRKCWLWACFHGIMLHVYVSIQYLPNQFTHTTLSYTIASSPDEFHQGIRRNGFLFG